MLKKTLHLEKLDIAFVCARANPRDSQCLERILRLGFAFHVFLEQILLKQPAVLEQILEQAYSAPAF